MRKCEICSRNHVIAAIIMVRFKGAIRLGYDI
jgi:hypothetical protein